MQEYHQMVKKWVKEKEMQLKDSMLCKSARKVVLEGNNVSLKL